MTANDRGSLFNDWLARLAKKSSNDVIQGAEAASARLLNLSASLPANYGWRVTDADSVMKQLSRTGKSVDDINTVYWHDTCRSVEALAVLGVWRASELLETSVDSMNRKAVLAPAVLSRSLLELSAAYLRSMNQVRNCINDVLNGPTDGVAISTELETALLRRIYGTRIGEPAPEHKAYQVLTDIDQLGKWKRGKDLQATYELLCEVAHPNTLGYARFAAAIDRFNSDGSHTVRIERDARSEEGGRIREATLWAIGWSTAAVVDSFQTASSSIALVLTRWPRR